MNREWKELLYYCIDRVDNPGDRSEGYSDLGGYISINKI